MTTRAPGQLDRSRMPRRSRAHRPAAKRRVALAMMPPPLPNLRAMLGQARAPVRLRLGQEALLPLSRTERDGQLAEGAGRVSGFAAQRQASFAGQQLPQRGAYSPVPVDDQDADSRSRCAHGGRPLTTRKVSLCRWPPGWDSGGPAGLCAVIWPPSCGRSWRLGGVRLTAEQVRGRAGRPTGRPGCGRPGRAWPRCWTRGCGRCVRPRRAGGRSAGWWRRGRSGRALRVLAR
jgi:hypothetical protein